MSAYRRWRHIPDRYCEVTLSDLERAEYRQALVNMGESMEPVRLRTGCRVGPFLALNRAGTRPPIFWCFNNWAEPLLLSHALGSDQPVFAMHSFHRMTERLDQKVRFLEPLAEDYARAALLAAGERGVMALGGNCQAAPIAEAVAHRLCRGGARAPLLMTLEYLPRRPYAGPLCMMFGAESHLYNPFLTERDPVPLWRRQHANFTWGIIPGRHGRYFLEPAVSYLGDYLCQALASYLQSDRVPDGPLPLRSGRESGAADQSRRRQEPA